MMALLPEFGSQEVAVLIGAFVGVAGSLTIFALRRHTARTRLRIALRSEILTMAEHVDDAAHKLAVERPHRNLTVPVDVLIDTVYRENAADVGLLADDEVAAVTAFYSRLSIVRRHIRDVDEHEEIPPGTADALRRQFVTLQHDMLDALVELEDNLRLSPGRRTTQFDHAEYESGDLDIFPTRVMPVEEADGEDRDEDN